MQRRPREFACQMVFSRRKNTVRHMNFVLDTILCGAFSSPSMAEGANG